VVAKEALPLLDGQITSATSLLQNHYALGNRASTGAASLAATANSRDLDAVGSVRRPDEKSRESRRQPFRRAISKSRPPPSL